MSAEKNIARLRRATRGRARCRRLGVHRLVVFRSNQHLYAQIIAPWQVSQSDRVLAVASSLEKGLDKKGQSKKEIAQSVGQRIAERALSAGVKTVAFDRSGYRYHGRVKVLAEAARTAGMQF